MEMKRQKGQILGFREPILLGSCCLQNQQSHHRICNSQHQLQDSPFNSPRLVAFVLSWLVDLLVVTDTVILLILFLFHILTEIGKNKPYPKSRYNRGVPDPKVTSPLQSSQKTCTNITDSYLRFGT